MNMPWTRRNGQDVVKTEQPEFEQFTDLPRMPDPRQRRISAAAADAAQYVIDLEAEVARQKEELGFERNRNSLLDETNKILHEQIATLEQENRKLRDSNSRVRTKLQVSGQIVLEAMREAEAWQIDEPAVLAEPVIEDGDLKASEDAAKS